MLTIEKLSRMSYHGHNELNHHQADHHYLADQESYDLLCQTEDASAGTENPYAVAVAHAYKMGKIAGIKQERQRRKRRVKHG